MVKDHVFEHRPISELMAIVKNDFKKFDSEGLIDEGILVKTVLQCNEKLGIHIREIKEVGLSVDNYQAQLPLDFEKVYYVCALKATNTVMHTQRNPFDNNFDQDVIYDAKLDRDSLGCVDNYMVTINKETHTSIHSYGTWVHLDVSRGSEKWCHLDCPNKKKKGTYTIEIKDDIISTPFRSGDLYLMYIGMMKDENGEITFPFHPMITPYYEWAVKEKILSDAIFNSDAIGVGELFKLAQNERTKAWMDAFNFTTDRNYGEYVKLQRKKELSWYNQYFKYFQ